MICDSEANAVFVSDRLGPRYPKLVNELHNVLADHGIPLRIIRGTKDIWCRDYMPVQAAPGQFVQFRYSPDYLQEYDHLITLPSDIQRIPEIEVCHQFEITLDGGNLVRWGNRLLVTDKVIRENPGVGRDKLRRTLRDQLQVEKVIEIPQEPGDVTGHADGMVRFVDAQTVVVNDYSQEAPAFGQRLLLVLKRARLNHLTLPYHPENKITAGIPSAVGCYANFLMVRGLIVLPRFGIPEDEAAKQVLVEQAPHHAIESIDCSDLAREGGVLNCVTWTIAAGQQNQKSAINTENPRE